MPPPSRRRSRQGRTTARGLRFTANHVGNLRRHWNIPRFDPPTELAEGELLTIKQSAQMLSIAPSTIHRALGHDEQTNVWTTKANRPAERPQTMSHRVVVNVIPMADKIIFIADQVLPKPLLLENSGPDGDLSALGNSWYTG